MTVDGLGGDHRVAIRRDDQHKAVVGRGTMGNETFLISNTTPSKPAVDARDASGLLLAAKNSIPLFWYMLFDHQSLVPAEGVEDSGEVIGYLALSSSTSAALALARLRWPHVRAVIGTGTDKLFAKWTEFVEGNAAAFIHCETWEWSCLFKTRRTFRSHLLGCIAAFDHVPRLRKGRPALNCWWRQLLGQCGAVDRRDDRIRPLGDFSYCGVAYGGRKMTWSCEHYET
jgi:hypothetical protein